MDADSDITRAVEALNEARRVAQDLSVQNLELRDNVQTVRADMQRLLTEMQDMKARQTPVQGTASAGSGTTHFNIW